MHLCLRFFAVVGWIFPECVARVPVSLWGSGGWGCVLSTLRLCPQPFATVRNHSREGRMAVPMVSSAKGVTFGCFQRCVAAFRVASVALSDIQTYFVTCRKSFCVAGAILLHRFQKVSSSSRGRRSTLDFAWQAQHFRRVLWRQVVTRCKFRGRRGILWDVLKIDGSLARNIDFEVANLEVRRKLSVRKTSILKLQSMKIEEVSHEMLFLVLPRVSSRVSGFPVASPCLLGKLQNLSFSKLSKQVVMSFCVAGVTLCDILTCLTRRKSFCVCQAQYCCVVLTRWVAVFVAGAALWRHLSSFCMAGAALQTCRIACFTRHAPNSTLTPPFTLHTPHFTFHTLHSTL